MSAIRSLGAAWWACKGALVVGREPGVWTPLAVLASARLSVLVFLVFFHRPHIVAVGRPVKGHGDRRGQVVGLAVARSPQVAADQVQPQLRAQGGVAHGAQGLLQPVADGQLLAAFFGRHLFQLA